MAQPTWQQITAAATLMGLRYEVNHFRGCVDIHWDTPEQYDALYQLAKSYDLFDTGNMSGNSRARITRSWISIAMNRFSGQFEME